MSIIEAWYIGEIVSRAEHVHKRTVSPGVWIIVKSAGLWAPPVMSGGLPGCAVSEASPVRASAVWPAGYGADATVDGAATEGMIILDLSGCSPVYRFSAYTLRCGAGQGDRYVHFGAAEGRGCPHPCVYCRR